MSRTHSVPWRLGLKRRTTSMRPLIFATLAMLLPAVPAFTQPQTQTRDAPATVQPDPAGNLAGTHSYQTSGGDADNAWPHIYKKCEHISRSYGAFDAVKDLAHFNLTRPPTGSRWVKFGDNYLLVDDKSRLISDIVKSG